LSLCVYCGELMFLVLEIGKRRKTLKERVYEEQRLEKNAFNKKRVKGCRTDARKKMLKVFILTLMIKI